MAEMVSSSGSTLRLMVTWHGTGTPKQWHGVAFEPNKPVAVEHLPELVRQEILQDIDRGGGDWTYEYVVEPAAEEPEPEPELDPDEPDDEGNTVYRARPAVKKTPRKPVRRRR